MLLLAKAIHIAAVALWFGGLFLLPRLLASRARADGPDADRYFIPVARRLYFHLMTPAAVLAVTLGGGLVAVTPVGAWLPAKLLLVAVALALHAYFGLALFDLSNGRSRHRPLTFSLLGWLPLLLATGIIVLTAAKPVTIAPLDAETRRAPLHAPLAPGLR